MKSHLSVFTQGQSLIHRLDPRAKIGITLSFIGLLIFSVRWSTLVLGLALAVGSVLIARLPAKAVLKQLIALNLFILLLFLVLPITQPTAVGFQFGVLTISAAGLSQASAIALKSNAILLILFALLSTVEIAALGQALYRLGWPAKLVHLLLLTFRYITVLNEEYHRLTQAMKIRGFRPRFCWHTYRSFAYLIGMLLVKSLDRSERILAAMKCRGFQGQFYLLTPLTWQLRDSLFVVLSLLLLLMLSGVEWYSLLHP